MTEAARIGALAPGPMLGRLIVQTANVPRTQRFVQLVREEMRRTGLVQVDLNPCDIWTPEELLAAIRISPPPLRPTGARNFTVVLRDMRVRCPSNLVEYDYELVWEFGGATYRGMMTLLATQVLVGSLDPSLERPIHASICYRGHRILRLELPQAVRHIEPFVRTTIARELAGAGTLCLNLLGRSMIGIG